VAGGGGSDLPPPGLWIGTAAVEKVAQVNTSPETPVATASQFLMRVIVHVDGQGTARLLQHVTQMWKEGTYRPDPADPTKQVVDEPGRYVLIADDSLLPQFAGSGLRDGSAVGRRVSSASFAFRDPIPMESGGAFGRSLDFRVTLGYRDPLNPFAHRYHPDHDNKDERFERVLDESAESWDVTRDLRFEFTAEDPDRLALPGWGDLRAGGMFRETIHGIHRDDIRVEGTFRLERVSTVSILDDGIR